MLSNISKCYLDHLVANVCHRATIYIFLNGSQCPKTRNSSAWPRQELQHIFFDLNNCQIRLFAVNHRYSGLEIDVFGFNIFFPIHILKLVISHHPLILYK